MLFVSISDPQKIPDKKIPLELRLDLFPSIDWGFLKKVLQDTSRPIMFTLRKSSHGGKFIEPESRRENLIEKLLDLHPPFFDLEYDTRAEFLHKMIQKHPKTKIVISYHNFQQTPNRLDSIYHSMEKYPAFSYKIATWAHSTNDALKMLVFSKKHPKVSAIAMGKKGEFTRILGPIVANPIDYASVDVENQTAPGQLSFSSLMDLYRYSSLNPQTAIFALVGDPIEKSPGHVHHNAVFQKRRWNAVYVKMELKADELVQFIPLAKQLGIRGLSVTMPLKEKILPFIDQIEPCAKEIGAVNTLLFHEKKIVGTNTDGVGALDAIEKRGAVRGKRVVVVGAGGVARAVVFEAKKRGAHVCVLNRTIERAKKIAQEMECDFGGLEDVPISYDVLIQCSSEPMPIDPRKILAHTLAMDVVYSPDKTDFLKEALAKNCQIIEGKEMFFSQAEGQTAFWT